jgi:hypothetical protein
MLAYTAEFLLIEPVSNSMADNLQRRVWSRKRNLLYILKDN